MAARRVRVLVIDLDAQASATKVLGVELRERCSMADVMLEPDRYTLRDAIAATDWGLILRRGDRVGVAGAAPGDGGRVVLRRQLEGVAAYDIVLIDCPPSLGVRTLNAL